jgi:endonuclease/exonuclease/phosphatase family metal-dependent hydrolase
VVIRTLPAKLDYFGLNTVTPQPATPNLHERGYQAGLQHNGQATLSRWKISNPRVIHFHQQSDFWKARWFKPNLEPFQQRLGGRVALASEFEGAGVPIVCYNLHLESRGNDELRLTQMSEVLRDAVEYGSRCLQIIAGDLNLNASKKPAEEALGPRWIPGCRSNSSCADHAGAPPAGAWSPYRLGVRSRCNGSRSGSGSQPGQRL